MIAGALFAVQALAPSAVDAADRHVAPGGSGTACTQVAPCSFGTGVKGATSGDVVHVPGDLGPYPTLEEGAGVKSGVAVVGEGSQIPSVPVGTSGGVVVNSGGSISGLALSRIAGFSILITVGQNATASRMRLESATGVGVEMLGGTLSDSFVRYTGTFGVAIQGRGDVLRNVTVLSTKTGVGAVRVYATPGVGPGIPCQPGSFELRNSIVRGADIDLQADGVSKECPATFRASSANYRATATKATMGGVVDLGGNQTAVSPLLAADGLHQLAGSPTIDAGTTAGGIGPLDLDGEARLLGSAPDIGADEFPSPPVSDTVAPVGSALQLTPRRFRAGGTAKASASKAKRPSKGSSVTYALSETATTSFFVQRKLAGRRKGKACLTGRAAKQATGKRCTKLVRVRGSFTHAGSAGANRFRFAGVVAGKALRPGRYKLVGTPTDPAGNKGTAFSAPFQITAP